MTSEGLAPTRRSSWPFKAKVGRSAWSIVWWALGRTSTIRIALLRLFGGRVGRRCRIGRGVEIAVPWHIRIGDDVEVGDETILYSLGTIAIESGVRIDVRAHLCAGTHDHRADGFPLLRSPIHVERFARIGAAAFIGPGVRIGERAGIAPQTVVFRDVAAAASVQGNPARVDPDVGQDDQSTGART